MRLFDIRKISSMTDMHVSYAKELLKNIGLNRKRFVSTLTVKECNMFIEENLGLLFLHYGLDRFQGWVRLGFYCVTLTNERFQLRNPVFHKAIGRISKSNGETRVTVTMYRGLTDLFSLLTIFLISYVLLGILTLNYNFVSLSLLSLLISFVVAGITYLITCFSEEAIENEEELLDFLKRSMELRKVD